MSKTKIYKSCENTVKILIFQSIPFLQFFFAQELHDNGIHQLFCNIVERLKCVRRIFK